MCVKVTMLMNLTSVLVKQEQFNLVVVGVISIERKQS